MARKVTPPNPAYVARLSRLIDLRNARFKPRRVPPLCDYWERCDLKSLGSLLRSIREWRGLSIREASVMSGLSRGYLSGVESGRTEPGLMNLARLSAALGLTAGAVARKWDAINSRKSLPTILRPDAIHALSEAPHAED